MTFKKTVAEVVKTELVSQRRKVTEDKDKRRDDTLCLKEWPIFS